MTEMSWPFDSSPQVAGSTVSESNWTKMASLWLPSGVVKAATNELQVYGDSSGRQVKVKTGKAWVSGTYYESDAEVILAIGANASGSTRIDRVVVRVNWTNNTCALTVIAGTPGAAAPAITRSSSIFDLSLASINVVNNSATINATDVTDERNKPDLCGYVESRLAGVACSSSSRPSTYPVGGRIFELDTGRAYINVGTETTPVWGHGGEVDVSATSPHHTLGTGQYQAAAGNHTHSTGGLATDTLPGVNTSQAISGYSYVFTTNSAPITLTLPAANPATQVAITIRNDGSANVSVNASGGSPVYGGSFNTGNGSVMDGVIVPRDAWTYKSDGSAWRVV